MFRGSFKIKRIYFLILLLGLIFSSCHNNSTEPKGGSRPPLIFIEGIGNIVVSPLRDGLSLIAIRANRFKYSSYPPIPPIESAELINYRVESSQLWVEKSQPLYPSALTDGFEFFDSLEIYPVDGTTNSFLLGARFITGETVSHETFFLNENGKFKQVKGGITNIIFKISSGYYFSIVSNLYWAPLVRYAFFGEDEKNYNLRISPDRLPGFFEAYPYTSAYHPRIFLKNRDIDLSRLFIVEGGEIIGDTNLIYFQGCDAFDLDLLRSFPSRAEDISSYLFIGNVKVNGYSMDVTDVRYIRFNDPATFVTIMGVEYLRNKGLVVYAREFPKDITTQQEITKIKDKLMILDPENLKIISEKEILWSEVNSSEANFNFPLLVEYDENPPKLIAFDKRNQRIVSVMGSRVLIIDLGSFRVETLELPSPWICDISGTGVWVDATGHIWVIARDVNSGKVDKKRFKPGVILFAKLRFGVLSINIEEGKYSVRVVEELK